MEFILSPLPTVKILTSPNELSKIKIDNYENKINIIIDNFKLHTLLPTGEINGMVQTMLSIASTFASLELSMIKERLNSGRDKFVRDGGKLGRKIGSEKDPKKLLIEHSDIVKFLRQGQSIRNTMTLTGKSSGTVQKIKKLIIKN